MPQYEVTVEIEAYVSHIVVEAKDAQDAFEQAKIQVDGSDAYDLEIEEVRAVFLHEAVEI